MHETQCVTSIYKMTTSINISYIVCVIHTFIRFNNYFTHFLLQFLRHFSCSIGYLVEGRAQSQTNEITYSTLYKDSNLDEYSKPRLFWYTYLDYSWVLWRLERCLWFRGCRRLANVQGLNIGSSEDNVFKNFCTRRNEFRRGTVLCAVHTHYTKTEITFKKVIPCLVMRKWTVVLPFAKVTVVSFKSMEYKIPS